jgi:hypothetical protein
MKQELMEQFSKVIEEAFENCLTDSAHAIWDLILDECTRLSFTPSGKRQRKKEDWFEAGIDLLDPVIAAKGTAQHS